MLLTLRKGIQNMKLTKLASSIALAGGLLFGQAHAAIIIDDWNVDTSVIALSDTVGISSTVNRLGASNGGTFWGSRGNAYAMVLSGGEVETVDCAGCQQGHGTDTSNTNGHGFWNWNGSATNMAGNVSLFYDADVAGGDVIATFVGDTTQEVWWSDITAGAQTLAGAISVTNVTDIFLDWFSVGGAFDPSSSGNYSGVVNARDFGLGADRLDFNVDNFQVDVSEPTALALLGLGLAGLAFRRKAK